MRKTANATHVDDLPEEAADGAARDEGGGEEAHGQGQRDAERGGQELEDLLVGGRVDRCVII